MKILVVSHNSFSKFYNNGKTLESIFADFAKEELAQVYFTENMNPDFEFCNDYFKITDIGVLKSLFKLKRDCGEVLSPNFEDNFDGNNVKSSRGSKLFRFAKSNIDHFVLFRDILWSFNSWKSRTFLQWIEKIKPDLVFYVGGNFGFSHKISLFISKKYNIPFVTYFTDDYLIYPKSKNILDLIQKKRIKSFYHKTIKNSAMNFTIGESMTKEYSRYFKKDFFSIMNSVKKLEYIPYNENHEIVFSYFGGLHLNRWKMLVKIAHSLPKQSLNIYTIDQPSVEILTEFKNANIIFKGPIKGIELQNAILDSDVLLHVESDDVYNMFLTRLSVSTKIPEYLMSGRLVVGFGPPAVASMKLLSDNKIGIVLSSSLSQEELTMELVKITSDFELRKKMGLQGYNFAVNNFDNIEVAKNFKMKIQNLISRYENTK